MPRMGNFYTDVIKVDPRFSSTSRINDLALLEPTTCAAVKAVMADAEAHGIALMVWETFRSQARQAALFAQGVTKLRNVGVHNFGLACDIVKVVNGEPSWKGDFSWMADFCQEHGLIWGGNWGHPDTPSTFVDEYHVQRVTVARQASLFRGDWYPDEGYDPTTDDGE
jgi:D-alanyl-D-alanine carboxypeptidase